MSARHPVPDTAFHDLPASSFPFTCELMDAATGEVRWSATVQGPGALRIPAKAEINEGAPVSVRLRFPDGTVFEEDPAPEGEQ